MPTKGKRKKDVSWCSIFFPKNGTKQRSNDSADGRESSHFQGTGAKNSEMGKREEWKNAVSPWRKVPKLTQLGGLSQKKAPGLGI